MLADMYLFLVCGSYLLALAGRVLLFRNQAKADFRYLMNIHYAGSGESLDSLEYSCMIDAATLHSTSSYGHACTTHNACSASMHGVHNACSASMHRDRVCM